MSTSVVYNIDCMEYMRTLPDKAFDLAIVDPPYGDGGVAGKRNDSAAGSTGTENWHPGKAVSVNVGNPGASRTGGTWASKYGKKSLRGTSPRISSTLTSCSVSHVTRLSGGQIISVCRRPAVSWCGGSCQSARISAWPWPSMRGQVSGETPRFLSVHRRVRQVSRESTLHRSR